MRKNYYFFFLTISILFISAPTYSQAPNFNETWKEFLENQKIFNIIGLTRPDKVRDQPNYAKYLLMNTNSSLCQSKLEEAESMMAEIQEMDSEVYTPIPGFVEKMEELETKIQAYYDMDVVWKRFLQTNEITLEELDAVPGAKMSCETRTLAKYSFMTAYYHFCQGNISESKNIFENRTIRLIEQTDLNVGDVEGLPAAAAKMKALFRDMAELEIAWRSYVKTNVSPGFDIELPLFPCNPIPKMKELVLKGAVDMCNLAPEMLEEIKQLKSESGVAPDRELSKKLKDFEAGIEQNNSKLAALNEAWEAFIPNNKVTNFNYGYEYCSKEPLIRAYIMDGFANVCAMADEMLQKIDDLQNQEMTPLEQITVIKINELAEIIEQYQSNGEEIEMLWSKFVAQGDQPFEDFESTTHYCDNVHQVKDWTIKGLSVSCEEGQVYLELIDDFQRTIEFSFTEDVECRVQDLRIKIWECRYEGLQKLARIEASPESYEEKLKELMAEYGMGERPEVCSMNK